MTVNASAFAVHGVHPEILRRLGLKRSNCRGPQRVSNLAGVACGRADASQPEWLGGMPDFRYRNEKKQQNRAIRKITKRSH
jgi:hypothetical protein